MWDSLTQGDGSTTLLQPMTITSTLRKSSGTASTVSHRPNRKVVQQPVMLSQMDPSVINAISTFDKPERSTASPDTRRNNLFNRIYRANDKVQEANGKPADKVDDSLMRDGVGMYLQEYRHHAEYKASERIIPPTATRIPALLQTNTQQPDIVAKAAAALKANKEKQALSSFRIATADIGDEGDEDDDDAADMDDEEDAEPIVLDPHTQLALDMEEEDRDDVASRMFVAPARRIPNPADTQTIKTFSEYTGPSPANSQFNDNIRHVKGRERGVYMEIRDNAEIYNVVSETMDRSFRFASPLSIGRPKCLSSRPLANMELQRIAVTRGIVIPDPPKVSKAEVQDGLCAPNPSLGERPCVRGVRCASWKMCLQLMKDAPEHYKGAKPFVCKEFYFGDRGAEVQAAIAHGRPLAEVQSPELIMCVMCHLRIVTKWYKKFQAGLVLEPPHVLNSFQMDANVPGGYPDDACLLGDEHFYGIVGVFVRHVPGNYKWDSSSGNIERDQLTGRMVAREGPVVQRWLERSECLDFQ
jgi:hypothetical protein